MSKIAVSSLTLALCLSIGSLSFASLTKEQSEEVAEFATSFINEGNERRDERGYPLLVYALSNSWNTCIEIRRSGYFGELYHVKNNNYHKINGQYLDLGEKWTMDCGDFVSYVYHQTLDLDMLNHENDDPWHIKDMYADANKGANSKYFEFVYKNVPISALDDSKLQKGDIVLYFGPRDNHGLLYVGEGFQTAHASRNGIKYSKNPPILGFEVITLNRFYTTSTVVSIVRVKDGVVPEDQKVNGTIIWPDTGETGVLIERERLELEALAEAEESGDEYQNIVTSDPLKDLVEQVKSGDIDINKIIEAYNANEIYIEKDMIGWISDGLKRFYFENSGDSGDENTEE